MTRSRTPAVVDPGTIAAVLTLVVMTGCGASRSGVQSAPATPAPAHTQVDTSRYTEADVYFMAGMIAHHGQAIVMARMAPTHGASPALLTLAGRIINAQQDEISLMQQWLRDRGQSVPEPALSGQHAMHDGAHDMLMPGMLTAAQMQQLDAARGTAFDELFLRFMIQHHQGAVTMVRELFASRGAAQDDTAFKLASDVNVDQTTEIARMQRMLYDLLIGKEDQ